MPIYHDVEKVTVFVGTLEMVTTETVIRVLHGRNKREVRLHLRKDEH